MILLDSNYIVSFLIEDESNHERALELSEEIRKKEVIITSAILIEAINLLTKKLNKNTKAIAEIFDFIINEFKVIYQTEELTKRAMKTVIHYGANIGLADGTNIEVMKDFNIHEIVSFDPDFDNKDKIVRLH